MRDCVTGILFAVLLFLPSSALAEDAESKPAINSQAALLNKEGVSALNAIRQGPGGSPRTDPQWESVFAKFRAALKLEPTFETARQNLGIAHNNRALTLKPDLALNEFHKSLFWDEANITTRANLNVLFKVLHIDPARFEDRVQLGDKAMSADDWIGAVVEYRAALKIREDDSVRSRLKKALKELGENAL